MLLPCFLLSPKVLKIIGTNDNESNANNTHFIKSFFECDTTVVVLNTCVISRVYL